MITLAMSTEIDAERSGVWNALTDPDQVPRWRPGVLGPLDATDAYPRVGSKMRWRVRLRELPVTLEDLPLGLVPGERLSASFSLGLFQFRATFTLRDTEPPGGTRLGIKLSAPSEMPMVGGALDRFAVRRFLTELAAAQLQALRDWCEAGTACRATLPELPASLRAAAGKA